MHISMQRFWIVGKYSCLSAEFGLERASWPAFKACYFPLTALVALSWTAFWIPIGSASAGFKVRSVIGCALTISVLMVCLFGYGSPNPAVAYSIAIDEWKVQGLNVNLVTNTNFKSVTV